MTRRERRIEILGFDDRWLMIIGIPILGLVTDFLFNNSFMRYPLPEALVNWGISVFFSLINWIIIRQILIFFRQKFPEIKQGIKRVLGVLLVCFVSVIIVNQIGNAILAMAFGSQFHPIPNIRLLLPIFLIVIMMVAIYEAIYFYIKLQQSIRDEEQAKQAVVQAQLDALRNQSQPHFLFNSFNTLRDIIDQESKEEAKKFVDKLSNVYRFILESGSDNLTTLEKEIEFSKAYIYIQQERFGDNLKVEWNMGEGFEQRLVGPMSLQLLLENAIKHNVISNAKPLLIKVIANDEMLTVENRIAPKSTKLPSTKLGLKNIEKRYRLLSDKTVQVVQNNGLFKVSVPLLKPTKKQDSYAHIDR